MRRPEDEFVAAYVKEHAGETPAEPVTPKGGGDTEWPEVRAAAEGIVFRMPGKPERAVRAEQKLIIHHFATTSGGVHLDFQVRFTEQADKGKDYEPMAPTFFAQIVNAVEKEAHAKPRGDRKGMDDKGQENAPFASHPGLIYRATLPGDQFVSIWFVVIKDHLMQAVALSVGGKVQDHDRLADRFFASIKPLQSSLQGVWDFQAQNDSGKQHPPEYFKGCRLTIKEDKIVLSVDGSDSETWGYTSDAQASPRQIDITMAREKNPIPAIYEVTGDELKICMCYVTKKRPTRFESLENTYLSLIVLNRVNAETK